MSERLSDAAGSAEPVPPRRAPGDGSAPPTQASPIQASPTESSPTESSPDEPSSHAAAADRPTRSVPADRPGRRADTDGPTQSTPADSSPRPADGPRPASADGAPPSLADRPPRQSPPKGARQQSAPVDEPPPRSRLGEKARAVPPPVADRLRRTVDAPGPADRSRRTTPDAPGAADDPPRRPADTTREAGTPPGPTRTGRTTGDPPRPTRTAADATRAAGPSTRDATAPEGEQDRPGNAEQADDTSDRTVVRERPGGPWPMPERSLMATVLGVHPAAAVGVAAALTAVGVAVDLLRTGTLSTAFTVCYLTGCVLAAAWVRRSGLFWPMVAPPLLMAVAVPVVVLVAGTPRPGAGVAQRLLVIGAPLVNGFPMMAWTTGIVLALGVFRLVTQRVSPGSRGRGAARAAGRTSTSPPRS